MKLPGALAVVVLLAACSSHFEPIIDPATSRGDNLPRDIADCRTIADQQNVAGEVGTHALIGAGVGAALGAIAGAFGGGAGTGAAIGAAIGGTGGAASGGLSSQAQRDEIVRNCLIGRGYRVLN
jgi:outer membrane lipoprotein SlyB